MNDGYDYDHTYLTGQRHGHSYGWYVCRALTVVWCVLVCFGSSLYINIWWETPSIERSLGICFTVVLTARWLDVSHTKQRSRLDAQVPGRRY